MSGNATVASRRICRLSQLSEHRGELGRLADEQPHVGQELQRAHGGPLGLGRANDRTDLGTFGPRIWWAPA